MISIEKIYPSMVGLLKEEETKNFKLEHFDVTEDDVKRCLLMDSIHGRREYMGFKAGTYVKLIRKNKMFNNIVMSDTAMEKYSNMEIYYEAHGDVLIAGLGIGMILLGLQNNEKVTSITVIEKEQEILKIIKDQLPLNGKVTIIHGDIFSYVPDKKFNIIYFDIWDNVCGDNWDEIKSLQNKFRSKLKKGGHMFSWRKEDCRDLHRRDY